MNSFTEPQLLTDKSRLQEIFDLRVFCWENSPGKENINSTKFPNGYFDHLEEKSIHIISTDSNNNIIGAARLTVCNSLDELPYSGIFKVFQNKIPSDIPFLFYSRLVIHPNYRKTDLRKMFDDFKTNYHMKLRIPFGLVTVKPKRLLQILPYGFKVLGPIFPEHDKSYPFSSEHTLLLLLLSDIKQH